MVESDGLRDIRPLREQIEGLPLLGLLKSLEIKNENIEKMCEPLPETIRINPLMLDVENTIKLIESIGGSVIEWYKASSPAYKMPWIRGKQPTIEIKKMMQALHQTGRITQQEEVSMLPVQLLNPKEEDTILDACAAPGSKTTQLAEWTHEKAVVIGNEINPGRVNTLVSNTKRMGLHSITITKHDARSYPKIPLPGFDAAIVDAPCSGSGTMRKNLDVWWKWKPHSARSLHNLQLNISERIAKLLKPGGKMVYSTCSLDPVENEAVVAELIRKCPWLNIEKIDTDEVFPNLKVREGMFAWNHLDSKGEIEKNISTLIGIKESHISPGTSHENNSRNEEIEERIKNDISKCVRVYPSDNNTGGFFLALLTQTDSKEENARALRKLNTGSSKREYVPRERKFSPKTIDSENMILISKNWGVSGNNNFSWWQRGRTIAIANKLTKSWLYDSKRLDRDGYLVHGGYWHPLNVIHTGSVAFELSDRFGFRPKSKSINLVSGLITKNIVSVSMDILHQLLEGDLPTRLELQNHITLSEESKKFFHLDRIGAILLKIEHSKLKSPIPAWFASKLSLMIDDNEKSILLHTLEREK